MALSQVAETAPVQRTDPGTLLVRGSRLLLIICFIGMAIGLALLLVDEGSLRAYLFRMLKTVVMYRGQDTWWLVLCVAFSLYLRWSLRQQAVGRPAPGLAACWPDDPNPARYAFTIALLVLAFVGAGTYLFHHAHNVVLDEHMAEVQSEIFLSGRLLAATPEYWQDKPRAVLPLFMFYDWDHDLWGSTYRPVHAAIRAAFSLISLGTLTNAILTAVSVVLIVAVARRIWPDRRDAAVLAAILLATGPQFLFNGMTGFAWSAHLCLNLLWLWLYLRDDRLGHGLAALVGFAGVGLHQINPHPLFVLPFMLALLFARRWRLAAFYAVVYSAAALTWTFWHDIAVHLTAGPQAAEVAPSAGTGYVGGALRLLSPSQLIFEPLMVFNLLRLLAWQNIMIVPLAFIALRRWSSAPPTIRLLAWGCIVSMLPYILIMPNQNYAWGYRYAHGLLGSLALIAVHGWVVLSARGGPTVAVAKQAIIGFTALVVVVGLPMRAIQMDSFVRPLADANRYIKSLQADVIVVDVTNLWFPYDVIRNDPDLSDRPVVVSLLHLRPEQLLQVCRDHSVIVVDRNDLAQFGVVAVDHDRPFSEYDETLQALANGPVCRSALPTAR